MKKIKNFYKTHRIFVILMAVALVCLILIGTILIRYFYVNDGSDKYGTRLEHIEDYKLESSRLSDIEDKYREDTIDKITIMVTGKIVYIHIFGNDKADLVTCQGIANKILEEFTEEEKKFYDFQFTIKKEKTETDAGFLVSGAHNKSGTGLTWNNMRVVEPDPTEATE